MSVITVGAIEFLPYAGYQDPGLPDRVWRSGVKSDGDASGGTNLIQVDLKSVNVPVGNLFSVEQLAFEATDQAATAVLIGTAGMDPALPDGIFRQWVLPLVDTDVGAEALIELGESTPRLWLGKAAQTSVSGTLSFGTANDTGQNIEVVVWGYMWTPGALNAEGGPRRPPQGIFPQ